MTPTVPSLAPCPTCGGHGKVARVNEYARITDPGTSHEAALSMTGAPLAAQCAAVLDAITAAGERGSTAGEVAEALSTTTYRAQQNVMARRITDLRRRGLIRPNQQFRSGPTGRKQTVWVTATQPKEGEQ